MEVDTNLLRKKKMKLKDDIGIMLEGAKSVSRTIRDGLTCNSEEIGLKKRERNDLEVNGPKFNGEFPGDLMFSNKKQTL